MGTRKGSQRSPADDMGALFMRDGRMHPEDCPLQVRAILVRERPDRGEH